MANTALITGASSGIGAQFAHRLASNGFNLVLVARRHDRLVQLREQLGASGVSVEALGADLSTQSGLDTVLVRAATGDIHTAVLSAGVAGYGGFTDRSLEEISANWMLNATGPVLLTRALLPAMVERGEGSVMVIASALAFSAGMTAEFMPKRAAYVAAKAALVGLGRTLNWETRDSGVRVTAVCPGMVATEWNQGASQGPRSMSADDVVSAALVANAHNEAVCLPGCDDPAMMDALAEHESSLVRQNNVPDLAARFTAER